MQVFVIFKKPLDLFL